jgi:flagellar motor component MotA
VSEPEQHELYQLLLAMDVLEELLEDLEESGLTSLEDLASRLASDAEATDLLELIAQLIARGIRTSEDLAGFLSELEQRIEEPEVMDSDWVNPN